MHGSYFHRCFHYASYHYGVGGPTPAADGTERAQMSRLLPTLRRPRRVVLPHRTIPVRHR